MKQTLVFKDESVKVCLWAGIGSQLRQVNTITSVASLNQ